MKKQLSLLLALAMSLSLTACSGSSKNAETAAEAAGKTEQAAEASAVPDDGDITSWILEDDTSMSGTVRFWIPFKGEQGMDAMIADFNKTYPNIKIELNTYSNNVDGNIALNTSIMAGECDVVASFEIYNLMNRLENGMYQDITDKVNEEHISLINNWGTEVYNYEGSVYVFPCGGLSHYVAINMDAWEAAGLGELPTEWTWDEYIEASRAMTRFNPDGTTAVYGGSSYSVVADMLNFNNQVNGCNRYYNADGSCAFNSDLVKSQIKKYLEAEKEGIWFKMNTYRSDNDKSWFAYTDGRVNSTVISNLPRFIRDKENYPVDFITGFAPYPIVEKGQTNYQSGINYFSFAGIMQGCEDEDAAWAWLKWYSTYGSKYLTLAGHQSTWRGTDVDGVTSLIFGSEEAAAELVDVDSFKHVVGNPELPNAYDDTVVAYSKLTSIWEEYVMYVFSGEKDVDSALDEAAALGNDAINDAK